MASIFCHHQIFDIIKFLSHQNFDKITLFFVSDSSNYVVTLYLLVIGSTYQDLCLPCLLTLLRLCSIKSFFLLLVAHTKLCPFSAFFCLIIACTLQNCNRGSPVTSCPLLSFSAFIVVFYGCVGLVVFLPMNIFIVSPFVKMILWEIHVVQFKFRGSRKFKPT